MDEDAIWDHFSQVTVPAITQWQATCDTPPSDLCQLLVKYAQTRLDSEVLSVYAFSVTRHMYSVHPRRVNDQSCNTVKCAHDYFLLDTHLLSVEQKHKRVFSLHVYMYVHNALR